MNARRGPSAAVLCAGLCAGLVATLGVPPATAKLIGGQVEHRPASDPAAEVAQLGKAPGKATGKVPGTVWLAWTVPARGDETICGFNHGANGWGMSLADDGSSWGTRDDAPAIAVTTATNNSCSHPETLMFGHPVRG